MSTFEEREKGFEKKFVREEELQFKVNARRNKYLGEWAADKLGKPEKDKAAYVLEVIKSDFAKPGDDDVFKKIQLEIGTKLSTFENIQKLHEISEKLHESFF